MKASLKFREDQKPLARAKIPISILGLPFLSGISAGDSKELRLDLLTAFESGPSLRASYRPNDPSNPFTVSLRTGIGCFGSPAGAPMSMTAEFNLLGRNPNSSPTFTVLFKPRFGDFSFKKSVVSPPPAYAKAVDVDSDSTAVWVESPPGMGKSSAAAAVPACLVNGLSGALTGVEVSTRSVLPLKSNAVVRLRWGVRVPAELHSSSFASLNKLPLLVMSKISIEHMAAAEDKAAAEQNKKGEVVGAADVAEACIMAVRRQLEDIQKESVMLRKAVEDLKGSVLFTSGGGQATANRGRDIDLNMGRSHVEGGSVRGREKEEKANEELKKALMGAAGSAK